MPITLNGSGTVSGISVGGLPDGIIQSADIASGVIPDGGKILQVKQTVKKDQFSESVSSGSNSAVVTGLTVSITASSSSNKILLIYQIVANRQSNYVTIDKDGSVLTTAIGDASGGIGRVTAAGDYGNGVRYCNTIPIVFLDAPGDTNAHTYGVRLRHTSASTQTVYLNREDSTNNATNSTGISTVTAMEIAA